MKRDSERLFLAVSMRTFQTAYGPTSPVRAITYEPMRMPRSSHRPDDSQIDHHSGNVISQPTPRFFARMRCTWNFSSARFAALIDPNRETLTPLVRSNSDSSCRSKSAPNLLRTFSTAVSETPLESATDVMVSPASKRLIHSICAGFLGDVYLRANSDFPPSIRETPRRLIAFPTACAVTPKRRAISFCVRPDLKRAAHCSCVEDEQFIERRE